MGAICAAPTILEESWPAGRKKGNLLSGCRKMRLENVISDQSTAVVVDDNIITSQGVGTAIDFALKLIEVLDRRGKSSRKSQILLCFRA